MISKNHHFRYIIFIFLLFLRHACAAQAPSLIHQIELDKAIENQGEVLWGCLLMNISKRPIVGSEAKLWNTLPATWTVRDGIEAVYMQCRRARKEDDLCTQRQLRDLAYALSYQNRSWYQSLSTSYISQVSLLSSSVLLNQAFFEADLIEIAGVDDLEYKHTHIKNLNFLFITSTNLFLLAIANVILQEIGGFYYFLQKYTTAEHLPDAKRFSYDLGNFVGQIASAVSTNLIGSDSPEQTAKGYFNNSPDMPLFYSILTYLLQKDFEEIHTLNTEPKIVMASRALLIESTGRNDTKQWNEFPANTPLHTQMADNVPFFGLLPNMPNKSLSIKAALTTIDTCSDVTIDNPKSDAFPIFYLTVCPDDRNHYQFKMATDTHWYETDLHTLQSVINTLMNMTGSERVVIYRP